jgi:hypothetical protein
MAENKMSRAEAFERLQHAAFRHEGPHGELHQIYEALKEDPAGTLDGPEPKNFSKGSLGEAVITAAKELVGEPCFRCSKYCVYKKLHDAIIKYDKN